MAVKRVPYEIGDVPHGYGGFCPDTLVVVAYAPRAIVTAAFVASRIDGFCWASPTGGDSVVFDIKRDRAGSVVTLGTVTLTASFYGNTTSISNSSLQIGDALYCEVTTIPTPGNGGAHLSWRIR